MCASSVEQEFLEALGRLGQPDGGQPRSGACFLLLEPQASAAEANGIAELIGYGEGFGRDEITDAVQTCLEEAGLPPEHVQSVRVASLNDSPVLAASLRRLGVMASLVQSQSSDLYSASFPMAVAEAALQAVNGAPGPILIVGSDCVAGAAAAMVRGRGRA